MNKINFWNDKFIAVLGFLFSTSIRLHPTVARNLPYVIPAHVFLHVYCIPVKIGSRSQAKQVDWGGTGHSFTNNVAPWGFNYPKTVL